MLYYSGKDRSSIVIPEGVTTIQSYVFDGHSEITSVTFPSTLRYIGSCAFCATGITSVTIPDTVKFAASDAFAEKASVTGSPLKVYIPDEIWARFSSPITA